MEFNVCIAATGLIHFYIENQQKTEPGQLRKCNIAK